MTALRFANIFAGGSLREACSWWVVPWSDEMIAWGKTALPPDPKGFLRRWTFLHAGRVFGATGAFACYLLSALLS